MPRIVPVSFLVSSPPLSLAEQRFEDRVQRIVSLSGAQPVPDFSLPIGLEVRFQMVRHECRCGPSRRLSKVLVHKSGRRFVGDAPKLVGFCGRGRCVCHAASLYTDPDEQRVRLWA